MCNGFQGFKKYIFISPQQLSHWTSGKKALPGALHVGRDQVGFNEFILESFHHCLPGQKETKKGEERRYRIISLNKHKAGHVSK